MALLSVYGAVKEVEGFTQRQVDYLVEHVKKKIADFLGNRKIQAKGKVEGLRAIDAKIDGLEEKMVNNEIENATYKKWFKSSAFRTPILHPALAHNELIIMEKGLLLVEQPSQNFGESTGCSAIGI